METWQVMIQVLRTQMYIFHSHMLQAHAIDSCPSKPLWQESDVSKRNASGLARVTDWKG